MGNSHAFAAAASACLDHNRIADFIGNFDRFFGGCDHPDMAGNGANTGSLGQFFGFDLVAHCRNRIGWRSDKGNIGRLKRGRKTGLFRQKSIAWMHRLCAGFVAGCDNLVGLKIAVLCGHAAKGDGFIGKLHMFGCPISIGIDSNSGNAHFACRMDDPAGDFATIGNQDFFKHGELSKRIARQSTTG